MKTNLKVEVPDKKRTRDLTPADRAEHRAVLELRRRSAEHCSASPVGSGRSNAPRSGIFGNPFATTVRVLCIFLTLYALPLTTRAAWVTGTLQLSDFTTPNVTVRFIPISNPQADGSTLIYSRNPISYTATNGVVSVELEQGNYRVTFDGGSPILIEVPNDGSTNLLTAITTTALTFSYTTPPTTSATLRGLTDVDDDLLANGYVPTWSAAAGKFTMQAAGAGAGTVTHTAGALTLDLPLLGAGSDDIKSSSWSNFRSQASLTIEVEDGNELGTWTAVAWPIRFSDAGSVNFEDTATPGQITGNVRNSSITSAMIIDGAIMNADINASAAIALSKLATDPLARANHTGTQTASTISDFNSAAAGASAAGAATVGGDLTGTVANAQIGSGAIVNADVNASAAIALSKLATDPLARANHTGTQLASTISDFAAAAATVVDTQGEQDTLGMVTKTGTQTVTGEKTFSDLNVDRLDMNQWNAGNITGTIVLVNTTNRVGATFTDDAAAITLSSSPTHDILIIGTNTYNSGSQIITLSSSLVWPGRGYSSATLTNSSAADGRFEILLRASGGAWVAAQAVGDAWSPPSSGGTPDDNSVTSAKIANGAILNEDINASAAIALSKLATDPLARANHTGTQTASTISDFNSAASGASAAGAATVGGDLSGTVANAAVAANAVALATDTTGNYVATIADSGASEVTVANSGTENAAVTLALASTITRDTEIAEAKKFQIVLNLDGGGSAITTGQKGYVRIPYSGTITGWDIIADQTGSIVVDVWKDTYANFPPVDADSIAASELPTLSSAAKNQDTSLTWTASGAVTAGDYIGWNVDSAATVTRVTVSIYGTKN